MDTQSYDFEPRHLSGLARFALCADRLLSCIYSPSLQPLAEALRDTCTENLELWVSCNPHKVQQMVALVLKGLEYDSQAIIILVRLAGVHALRDLILDSKPQLLTTLIKGSLVNEQAFEKYSTCITALLGFPFMSDYSIPGILQLYASTMIELISKGDTSYLSSLNTLMRNNFALCIGSQAESQRYALTACLASLLGSNEPKPVLCALSCLASLARSTSSGALGHDTHNTKSLFKGDKGRKVIRLVMSTINSSLSTDDNLGPMSSGEADMLCNVIKALEQEIIHDWLTSKEAQGICRKIFEKLDVCKVPAVIQSVCAALATICESSDYFLADMKRMSTNICIRTFDQLVHQEDTTTWITTMPIILPFCDPSTFSATSIWQEIFSLAGRHRLKDDTWADRLQAAGYLRFLELSRTFVPIRNDLAPSRMRKFVDKFARTSSCDMDSGDRDPLMDNYNRALCLLLTDLQCDSTLTSEEKYSSTTSRLILDKLLMYESRKLNVTLPAVQASAPPFFQEAANTPLSGFGSYDWKDRLLADLKIEAQHQYTKIVSRMDVVCRDLERRAEANEGPLRDTEKELTRVQDLVNELRMKVADANTELQQRDTENQHVFEERQRLEGVISNLLAEIETGNDRLRNLENSKGDLQAILQASNTEFAKFKSEAQETIEELRDHNTELTNQVSSYTESRMQSEEEKRQISVTLQACQEANEQYREEIQGVKNHLSRTELDLMHERSQALSRLELTERQAQQICTLEDSLRDDVKQKELERHETEETVHKLQGRLQDVTDSREDLETALRNTKALADERIGIMLESHAAEIKDMSHELTLTKSRAEEAKNTLQMENASLRMALSKLKGSHERRCEEFQKAQELSKRLMAVMGGVASQTSPMPGRRVSMLKSPSKVSNTGSKRLRGRATESWNHGGMPDAEGDITTDLTFEADKENAPLSPIVQNRLTFRTEDSAILSELSGLGI